MSDPQLMRTPVIVMKAVKTRHPVTNEPVESWVEFKRMFVQLEPRRGRERFVRGSQESEVTHTIRGQYFDHYGLTPAMRIIVEESRVLEIIAIMPDHERKMELMITARETDSPI